MNDIIFDELLKQISNDSSHFEKSLEILIKKQTGSYYTAMELAVAMMRELVSTIDTHELYSKTFLDPCVGTGNFVFAYLRVCVDLEFTKEQYLQLLNNIYACDINTEALEVYKKNLSLVAQHYFGITLTPQYFESHVGGALLFDLSSNQIQYTSIQSIFASDDIKNGFDIVVTNPPYKNLKAEKGHYSSLSELEADKSKYEQVSRLSTKNFKYSITGTLNIYKLFVEEIVERYLAPNGVSSLLLPSSILSDKSCTMLRTRMLETCDIKSIRLIPENSSYVTSSQALCAILFHKGYPTQEIRLDGAFSGDIANGTTVSINDVIDKKTGNAILVLLNSEYQIRQKMMLHPTIGELDYIMNLRGELDITLNKKAIVEFETSYRFYRGRNIGFYNFVNTAPVEYATEDFVNSTAKRKYILAPRLICQQVVNMSKKKRISFVIAPSNCVLGNSCNFLSVLPNNDDVDIYFLLGILNSSLIEWFFKLTSSNNHINNYEIDNFPIPINYPQKDRLRTFVKAFLSTHNEQLLSEIDALVYEAYGITSQYNMNKISTNQNSSQSSSLFADKDILLEAFYSDIKYIIGSATIEDCREILAGKASILELIFQKKPTADKFEKTVLDCMEKKYKSLYNGEVLNHTTFKLSDLDLEMIRAVPQGGSWKDIPVQTVQKSKRLLKITKTGGRTTLYGRIDYSKPSYTITTYFNRPGNGTYIHPIHQRVLSVREAARLQSFPDDYMFYGNKSDMLKQVGNAVPVLLAYNLGKAIREKTGYTKSVDLFSGAGGMTYGFKLAGIHAVIANDIVENACITLKSNCPEIPILCGDITNEAVKQQIISQGKLCHADIICGGPPCQGFSLAGFRRDDDPRNQLFKHFIDIVSGVSPKVIVFENVEGLLSYQNGVTYHNIIELFSELGYYAEGRALMANHYGVPQRRKRVIILCTKKELNIRPSAIYPSAITPHMDKQATAYDTIFDLEGVECSDNAKYSSSFSSPILQFLKYEITADEYLTKMLDQREISSCEEDLPEEILDSEE